MDISNRISWLGGRVSHSKPGWGDDLPRDCKANICPFASGYVRVVEGMAFQGTTVAQFVAITDGTCFLDAVGAERGLALILRTPDAGREWPPPSVRPVP